MAQAIGKEYLQASVKRSREHSAYEGAAILKERCDLLREEVKMLDAGQMREAAVKLEASALRFLVDTYPPTETAANDRWTRSRKTRICDARRKLLPSSAGK